MSENKPSSQPPVAGLLWPHEIAFLILLGAAGYYSGAEFRGAWQPLLVIGAAFVAAVGVLIFRCRAEWRQLPGRYFFLLLLAAWVLLFQFFGNATLGYRIPPSLFAWLLDVYTSPTSDMQQGLWLPFIVMALFWWKRRELVSQPSTPWWPALFLVVLGLGLHAAGFLIQQTQFSMLGFLTGIYGLTGLMFGRHWLKASFFPYLLLMFSVPLGAMSDRLTMPLRLMVSTIVAGVAHLGLAPDLIRHGNVLTNAQGTFAYEVAAACSGIRSLTTLLVLTMVYGFVMFKSPWKRAVMIFSAVPLAILGNVMRLCFTIGVAEILGQDAGKKVETNAGFVTFIVALAGIFLVARWLEKSEARPLPENKTEAA